MPVLVAVVLVPVEKAVLVEVAEMMKVLASVEVVLVAKVVVLVAVLTSTAMFEVIVVLASVDGRESPTAQPSLADSM